MVGLPEDARPLDTRPRTGMRSAHPQQVPLRWGGVATGGGLYGFLLVRAQGHRGVADLPVVCGSSDFHSVVFKKKVHLDHGKWNKNSGGRACGFSCFRLI
ncbi:hypothetical protein J6590_013281 [Homalodisca vitripennis]|nr:hypothetical protein J6590_013281 [Homalodisca vitripennis]